MMADDADDSWTTTGYQPPPTERQLDHIKVLCDRTGWFDYEANIPTTIGEASDLIDELHEVLEHGEHRRYGD